MFKDTKNGFTLIELLLVIAIIGILSSIVIASINSVRLKARNFARLEDVRTLAVAFNLAMDYGPMPLTTDSPSAPWVCISSSCTEGWSEYLSDPVVSDYLASGLLQKPEDPIGGTRGNGGILYINPFSVYGVTGAYISWLMEVPGTCGSGVSTVSTADWITCYLKVD